MSSVRSSPLSRRVLLLAGVLLAESLIAGSLPHPWFHLHQVMAAPIVFGAAFLFFGRRKLQSADVGSMPVLRTYLLLHLLALAVLLAATAVLIHLMPPGTPRGDATPPAFSAAFWWIALWYLSILSLLLTLTVTLFPLRRLAKTLIGLRSVWIYAALTAVLTMSARSLVRWLWDAPNSAFGRAMQEATFAGTRVLLGLFYPQVIAVPSTHILGTPAFQVEVAGTCSGIEGLALMLIFTLGWLIFTRREFYLTRATLLIPIALGLSWVLNLVRIALLIAIGNAGHPQTAIDGFHSEAGWIMFNAVAIGFLLAVQRLRWLQRSPAVEITDLSAGDAPTRNVAAIYLLPFLAVLATSLLTHAASSGFDWLYPLRLFVAACVLWYFRKDYGGLDWRFGWLGPCAGAVVFLLWIACAQLQHLPPAAALQTGLTKLPTWQRLLWLTARTVAAVVTVPIAEELAFRGYLARRIVSDDVESVPYASLGWSAIIISSVVFGLLHGGLWLVGIVAGVAFALVAKRANRLGEAIAAHATANLLLAAWVLIRHNYTLW
jgi:exosortase E/protease (VPEID-CTERM system)